MLCLYYENILEKKGENKMFSDNLSTSLLQLCNAFNLSYEAASERCNLSPREFGNLARGTGNPTLRTLEKLCFGFNVTPNMLLGLCYEQQLIAMPVAKTRCLFLSGAFTGFPICPSCGASLEREFQAFCDRCGQMLDWRDYNNALLVYPHK